MFAITVKQPHAYHILNSGKDIENRTWKLPEHHRNTWIALHAGKSPDNYSLLKLPELERENLIYGAIIGFIKFSDCVKNHPSKWVIANHYHWVISEAMSIDKPILCRGNQDLWRVDNEIIQSENNAIYTQKIL